METEPEPETAAPAASPEPLVEAVAAPEPPPNFGPGLRPVAILPDAGREPALNLTEDDARAAWVAATSLWHPALLAKSEALPRIEDVDAPSTPEASDLRLLAAGASERLPSGYRTQTEDAGTPIVDGLGDRNLTIDALFARTGIDEGEFSSEGKNLVLDFLALGAATWWLGDLTVAMGHVDCLDRDALTREALAGSRSWAEGDLPSARNRLRAAFEVLTQAREKVYPVDSYLVDLTLLDPASRPEELTDALTARAAFTLLAPARAIEGVFRRDPDRIAALRTAIDEGWADVIGGGYAEADEPLLPLSSILWQFRKGGEVYREHLEGRNVETLARRRFGLYPLLPQIAKRFGFRFALHLGFDAGKFPIRPELKRLWESADGSSLEALNRPPIAGDKASEGVRLPWRIARSMKDDYTAALPVVHWAGKIAPWYADLRRALAHSPVLMRLTTVNDFFHLTDRPFESFAVGLDEYITPYLDQAIRRGDPSPISGRAEHARLRARFDAVEATRALALALGQEPPGSTQALAEIEEAVEMGRRDEATAALDQSEKAWAEAAARGIATGEGGPPGYLIVNPVGVARRVNVLLPEAAIDLRPEGPLRAAQYTDEGVWAVVDLAAFGYAWVPRESPMTAALAPMDLLSIKDRTLQNDLITVSLDDKSGGIRGVHGPVEPTARLGQQLVIVGLVDAEGKPALSKMKEARFAGDYGGPALVQATTSGTLHHPADDRRLASFSQRFRLWTGRPALEIEVTLSDLDPAWLESLAKADPWSNYLSCRWAWPDPESSLRRLSLLCPEPTTADRPETPDAIDISSRKRRTTLLMGGLAHHRRIMPRMLDTILIAGKESARTFRLGVALDLEHPWQAATDMLAPAFVVPTESGPPKTGPAGWLLAVDSKAVALTGVSFVERSGDGRGWGLSMTLLETSGRASRCKVRTFRDPVCARQIDFNGELIVDLPTERDAILIDLTPHELARIDITLE
jgi:alpha-mannosidase